MPDVRRVRLLGPRTRHTFVTESGEVLVNEINTLPGFTPTSMFPVLWEHSGMRYEELVEALVDIALRDHRAAG